MSFTLVKAEELTVNQPIPWALHNSSGDILMELGSKPESAQKIQSLIEKGAGRYVAEQPAQSAKRKAAKQAQHESGGFSFNQTQLKIGDSMQIQFQSASDKSRSLVTLIGYLADQSIIVTMPVADGRIMLIREGQSFIVRFFSGKNAYAFSAIAKKLTSNPYPYMHLSYPHEVRGMIVRGSSRSQARISCTAHTEDGKSYKSQARDISLGGALIAVQEKIGALDGKLLLKLPVQINGTEHVLALNCRIRSVNPVLAPASPNESATNLLGLSFENISSQDTLVISALLYQNMVND